VLLSAVVVPSLNIDGVELLVIRHASLVAVASPRRATLSRLSEFIGPLVHAGSYSWALARALGNCAVSKRFMRAGERWPSQRRRADQVLRLRHSIPRLMWDRAASCVPEPND